MRLQTEQDPSKPSPTFIPIANEAAEWMAKQIGGVPQSSIFEALASIPTTAHLLGGAVIARSPPRASSTSAIASSATRTCSSATARSSPRTSA